MVDEGRVLRLLRGVTDDVAVLKREATADEARRRDPIWLRGVKYTFITAIEACVDVAQHICAAEGWGPPADNGDAVRLLGERGVLAAEPAVSIRKAVGFRNVLVHEYIEVNDVIVIERLANLGDLENFVREVAAYVTRAS
ncbi:MAG: type VII toxin-antitoxin system HepT family RNase toxin [Streptosporangiaceae bacterium]